MKLKIGMTFRVTANTSEHNHAIGDIYKISALSAGEDSHAYRSNNDEGRMIVGTSLDGTFIGNGLYFDELEIVGINKEELTKQLAILHEAREQKVTFLSTLEEMGVDEYDEDTVKAYTMYKIVEDVQMSDIEKTTKIMQILG